MLSVSAQKSLWWFLLCATLGSIVIFGIFGLLGAPFGGLLLIWPPVSIGLCILCRNRLKACYRRAPLVWKSPWQLMLSDLLLVAMLFGTLSALWTRIWPDSFLLGLPTIANASLGVGAALLFANRLGYREGPAKYIFAFGSIFTVFGRIVVGGILFTLICFIVLEPGFGGEFARIILLNAAGVGTFPMEDEPFSPCLRAGFISLLLGFGCNLLLKCISRGPTEIADAV